MNTCFNCGARYIINYDPIVGTTIDGFCSRECEQEDSARLAEGNRIITEAEKQEHQFTDINKMKLDANAPAASKAVQDLKQMLGFNRSNAIVSPDEHD